MMAVTDNDHHRLGELLDGIAAIPAAQDCEIRGLSIDSRTVLPGEVFVALRGAIENGARYIHDAIAAGACAVLIDEADAVVHAAVPVIPVPSLRRALGTLASRIHGDPSRALGLIAVTGTNGKTTVAHLLADALRQLRGSAGYIGTLGAGVFGALAPATNTTPDPVTLHACLAELRARGCPAVALEASSHGIAQQRLAGTSIDVAVFTNLGHDHLDYHATLEDYAATKKALFRQPGLPHAVINIDDPIGRELVAEIPAPTDVTTYGLDPAVSADFAMVGRERAGSGWRLRIATPAGELNITTALPGEFNASNLIAAFAALCALGIEAAAAADALSQTGPVAGRMQRVTLNAANEPLVIVDYAHTPDSLERAIAALRADTQGELICVFGCGGDRDRSKRAPMGRVAALGAERVIITNDNPRFEAPADIVEEILAGIADPHNVRVVEDRAAAITAAIESAAPNDTVLIAGKGHEAVQETAGRRVPFSDVECAFAALQGRVS